MTTQRDARMIDLVIRHANCIRRLRQAGRFVGDVAVKRRNRAARGAMRAEWRPRE